MRKIKLLLCSALRLVLLKSFGANFLSTPVARRLTGRSTNISALSSPNINICLVRLAVILPLLRFKNHVTVRECVCLFVWRSIEAIRIFIIVFIHFYIINTDVKTSKLCLQNSLNVTPFQFFLLRSGMSLTDTLNLG